MLLPLLLNNLLASSSRTVGKITQPSLDGHMSRRYGSFAGRAGVASDVFHDYKNQIEGGMKTITAAGMGGVLVE